MCKDTKDVLIFRLEEQIQTKTLVTTELRKLIASLQAENENLKRGLYGKAE